MGAPVGVVEIHLQLEIAAPVKVLYWVPLPICPFAPPLSKTQFFTDGDRSQITYRSDEHLYHWAMVTFSNPCQVFTNSGMYCRPLCEASSDLYHTHLAVIYCLTQSFWELRGKSILSWCDGSSDQSFMKDLCGGSRFPLSLCEWSFTICFTPYNHK